MLSVAQSDIHLTTLVASQLLKSKFLALCLYEPKRNFKDSITHFIVSD